MNLKIMRVCVCRSKVLNVFEWNNCTAKSVRRHCIHTMGTATVFIQNYIRRFIQPVIKSYTVSRFDSFV